MKNIYVNYGEYEVTSADKQPVNVYYGLNVIHYIIKGQGIFNGRPLGEGDAFVCKKNEFCSYFPDKNDPWVYVWVSLRGADTEDFMLKYKNDGYVFTFNRSDDFGIVCKSMLNSPAMADCDYGKAVFKILSSYHTDYADILSNTFDYVSEAKRYIKQNYFTHITVEQVAQHVHLSRAYLRNIFFKKEGISPKSYIIKLRMERACNLLTNSNLSVGEIAMSVGYDDVFQFIKIFKKYMECSPTSYRKNF